MAGFFKMKYLWISGFILVSITTVRLQSNVATNGTKISAINKLSSTAKVANISAGVTAKSTNGATAVNSSHVLPRAAKPGDVINNGGIESQIVYNLDKPAFPGNNLGLNDGIQGGGGGGDKEIGNDEGEEAHDFGKGVVKQEEAGKDAAGAVAEAGGASATGGAGSPGEGSVSGVNPTNGNESGVNQGQEGKNVITNSNSQKNGSNLIRKIDEKDLSGEIVNSGMIHKQVVVNIENKLYPQFALNLGDQAMGGLQIVCFNDTGKCTLHKFAAQPNSNCTGNSSDAQGGGGAVTPTPNTDHRQRPDRRTTRNSHDEHTTSRRRARRRRPRRTTTSNYVTKHYSEYPDYSDYPVTTQPTVRAKRPRRSTTQKPKDHSEYYDYSDYPETTPARRTSRRPRRRTTPKRQATEPIATTDYTDTDYPESSTKDPSKAKTAAAAEPDYDYADTTEEMTTVPQRRKTTRSHKDGLVNSGPPKRTTCGTVKPITKKIKKKLLKVTRKPKKSSGIHAFQRNNTRTTNSSAYPSSLDICFQACQSIYKDYKP